MNQNKTEMTPVRQQLVEAALSVIQQEDMSQLSTARIAQELGLPQAEVEAHFPSLHSLYKGIQHYFWSTLEQSFRYDAGSCHYEGEHLKAALYGLVCTCLKSLRQLKLEKLLAAYSVVRTQTPAGVAPYMQETLATLERAISGVSPNYAHTTELAERLVSMAVGLSIDAILLPGLWEKKGMVEGLAHQASDTLEFAAFGLIYQPEEIAA